MPELDHLFPSKFLRTIDLEGHEVTVVIDRVTTEAVGKRQQDRPVVYFRGKKKGLILNRTNAETIAELARSRNTDAWPGTALRLYVTKVPFQGTLTDAIRIKGTT